MAWEMKRVLIVVRTYPTPSQKSVESSCTAGIADGKWVRLFPMPYRRLKPEQKFQKYQWIEMNLQKARNDPRIESFNPDQNSIKPVSEPLATAREWEARKSIIFPLKSPSLCQIRRTRDRDGHPTLGLFKPGKIKRLLIEPDAPDWTDQQRQALGQLQLFDAAQPEELEKIPFKFSYEFECAEPGCNGHQMICTDWEMGELYRKLRQNHEDGWEAPFRHKYERQMIDRFDTHFYVGTLHQYPWTWIIVGVFYPLPVKQGSLFGQH